MAQLSSNSQRTAGIEGSGTQSSTLQLVRETGSYATLLARAFRELNWKHEKRKLRWLRKEKDPTQSKQDNLQISKVSIQQEDNRPAQIEGVEQRKLAPGKDESDEPAPGPLSAKEVGISSKDKLTIEIQVGNDRLESSYLSLSDRFDELTTLQQQAIATALAGELPEQSVSIKFKDEFGNQSEFFANTEENKGWKVSDNPAENLSTHDIEQDLQRQKISGMQKIKHTMQTLKPEGGPDIFRGSSLIVLTDGDEVIVVDYNSGIIRDAERLDKIGNLGEEAVRDAAVEVAGTFGIKGGAAKGIAPPKAQKQRELTP